MYVSLAYTSYGGRVDLCDCYKTDMDVCGKHLHIFKLMFVNTQLRVGQPSTFYQINYFGWLVG